MYERTIGGIQTLLSNVAVNILNDRL